MATYLVLDDTWHLLTLDADPAGCGVGSVLLERLKSRAREHGAAAVSLVTTNDNLPALGFYQRRGFVLVALAPGAVDEARIHKPSIPLRGFRGIPIRDELRLEWSAQ